MKNYEKYSKLYDWKKPQKRQWVDNEILKAPRWCSVDLRDGNQALPNPMTINEKIKFFDYLVSIGFKEIEIGFPAASDTEYKFTRYLIENNKIPDDVTIQVITLANKDIIRKTIDAVSGAKKVIIHMYNSISKIQREVVFNKSKEEIKQIAVSGASEIVKYTQNYPNTEWTFEYSPESFTNTEIDYAIEVINSVLREWNGATSSKPIINITATLECSTPNILADQIEYVCENLYERDNTVISIHAHNDRGTAVAASELSLLAGAERVEGTLFGNGERTGNADIMNIAMNMYANGIDPELDFSDINKAKDIYENCTNMKVSPRHPYVGEYIFTAFSGSHQDAISKGLKNIKDTSVEHWEVPYLPIDPADLNRQYEPIIRINSQSGKGGISFILESEFGYNVPKLMQKQVGLYVKNVSDNLKRELSTEDVYNYFVKEFVNREDKLKIYKYDSENIDNQTNLTVSFIKDDILYEKKGFGNGPIDAFTNILREAGYNIKVLDYIQESLNENAEKSQAISYINIEINGDNIWAMGQDSDVIKSSFKAIVCAINRI